MSIRRLAWAALAVSALLFGGCSSMQSSEEAPVGDATGGGVGGTAGARGSQWTGGALDDPGSPLSKRVLYFEYDSAELLPESRDILRAHGSYLSSNRSTRITIEAAADAGGYALGELVRVTAEVERADNALWLPPQAVRNFNGRLFVVVQDGEAQRRADVRIGVEGEDRVEILEGVEEGQTVVGP